MRIWDLSPSKLCDKHLLREHRELHAIWTIIINNKKGYSKHPETLRWHGKLKALYNRHEQLVNEMLERNFNHKSNLVKTLAIGSELQNSFINTIQEQIDWIKSKKCSCKI